MKNWILALLIALCGVLGAATLRAAAQSVMTGPPTPPDSSAALAAVGAPAAQAPETPPNTTPPGAPPPAGAPSNPPAPAIPAGVIRDDPTVAPDKGQSADNNVSFPVDI